MMHLIEPLFDIAYLGFVIALGLRLVLEKTKGAKIYGIMAITLGVGDAFHLIPRVISHLTPDGFEKYVALLSWGEFVTSITMTVFYVLFYYHYKRISGDNDKVKAILIYILAVTRIVMVALPQNMWGTSGSYLFGILRNIPFAVMGVLLIIWTWKYRNRDGLKHTSILILASFAFYLPVVIGARFIEILGALMIPKTIAYVLLVVVGFKYFVKNFKADMLIKTATIYLILGLSGGVFYRELTKYLPWENRTTLSFVHVHLIALGFLFFLIIYLLVQNEQKYIKKIKLPVIFYNIGLAWTVVILMVKGIYTITSDGSVLFSDAAMSGIAGIGHIFLSIGSIWLMVKVIQIKRENQIASHE